VAWPGPHSHLPAMHRPSIHSSSSWRLNFSEAKSASNINVGSRHYGGLKAHASQQHAALDSDDAGDYSKYLPPLQRGRQFPAFVLSHNLVSSFRSRPHLYNWVYNPVYSAAAVHQPRANISMTFSVHRKYWEATDYVLSHADLFSLTGHGAASSPAAAVTYGPIAAYAQWHDGSTVIGRLDLA
jgi:hypothetical protein